MQGSSSILVSSNSLTSSILLPTSQKFTVPFRKQPVNSVFISSFPTQLAFNSLHSFHHALSKLHCTATDTKEVVGRTKAEPEFVEIGYIYSVHGLQGEVRVKLSTDFPELRFSKPGKRWLRQQVSGRAMIQEIELVEGRGHPGQQSWILRFGDIDTVDQALKLVGSTILVPQENRPELEEGEFYTHDLIGMKVILKETGESVGIVVSVFNSGASDLLHVELNSSINMSNQTGKPKQEAGNSGPLVWVPFVEAIVPDVDLDKREMLITPPKGLLELNIRSDERSKKERRQLEWKERKKFQKRVIAAKKKLCELEQQHVFDGFRHGEKSQKSLLADQIVAVNSKLLQQALQNIEMLNQGARDLKNALNQLQKCSSTPISKQSDAYTKLQEKGLYLTSHGKLAIVLVLKDTEGRSSSEQPIDSGGNEENSFQLIEALLKDNQRLVKVDTRSSVPLVLVCPAHSIGSLQKLFSNHKYFNFDSKKVLFLEEEKLPVVSIPLEEPKTHKILMKSPWEIVQKPVGSGGVISLLSSNNLLDNLSQWGAEYIEVCNINLRHSNRHELLGLVDSRKANVGLEAFKDMDEFETNLDMIFSMSFMKKLTKKINELHFQAIPKTYSHVKKVDKDWVDVMPSSPNSFEIHSSIYSCLNSCSPSEVCVLEVTE